MASTTASPSGIDPLEEIEALVAAGGRWAGTGSERLAARQLARRLRSLGRDAELEPIEIRPDYGLTHAIGGLTTILGSALARRWPRLGLGALLLSAASTYGDVTTRFHLLRRLTRKVRSQNVFSRERGAKRGVLVLVAHYDTARTGWVFDPTTMERRARLGRRLGREIGPFEPFAWAQLGALGLAALRAAGLHGKALGAAQLAPVAVLAGTLALLLQVRRGEVVPGANDNASGVATVLRLAERYGGRLRDYDVWVVLTSGEEGGLLGMREWLRAHHHELDPERTVFLNVDIAGAGTVRYTTKEGLAYPVRYSHELIELCEEIRAEDRDGRFGARPMVSRLATDACVAAQHRYRAIQISCLPDLDVAPHYHQPTDTPDQIDPEALERAYEFCSQLIERLDRPATDGHRPREHRSAEQAVHA
jgi:hypothetical protein